MADFDEAMKEAARLADRAVARTMSKYADHGIVDEPEITGVMVGQLDAVFDNNQIGGLTWKSTIVRNGKGTAAEEKKTGADLLLHVKVQTQTESYSKSPSKIILSFGRDV